ADEPPAVIAQRMQAMADGYFADFASRAILQNLLLDLRVHVHPFKDGMTAEITGVAAFAATYRLEHLQLARKSELRLDRGGRFRMVLGFAMLAQGTHEALGEHGFERGGHQVGLNFHVHETRDRAG